MERSAKQLKQRKAEQKAALPSLIAACRSEANALLEAMHLTAAEVSEHYYHIESNKEVTLDFADD